MAIIGEWIRRVGYRLRRSAMEDELRREMEAHRAQMHEPRAFGNTLRLREEARDAWGWTWLDDLMPDTRFAWRALRRSPTFALTAIATLALGIGANAGIFTVVNSLLLRPLYTEPDDVVAVYGRSTAPSRTFRGVSYSNYLDLREGTTAMFAELAAASTRFVALDAGDGTKRTLASGVTANYFRIFDRPLAVGRAFTLDEERIGSDSRVAIISYPLWQQRGGAAGVLGESVRVNGETFTVIGVTAKGFTGTAIPGPDLWLPLGAGARDEHNLGVVGRLREGVSIEAASQAVAVVARRLEQAFPAINAGYTLEISRPWRLAFMPGSGSGVMTSILGVVLMVMPSIVLLVACLNLANLLLARGHLRRHELGIRSSLGGGRGRLTRQLLTEGALLSVAGGALGLLLSMWATTALVGSLRPILPVALTLPELDVDWRVLAATIAFSVIASLVFGGWPAWTLTGRAVASDLKRASGAEERQPRGIRVGNLLVIAQVALSLLLLACGGLFLMSAIEAATADPGFRVERGVLAQVDPGLAGYDRARAREFYRTLLDRLRAVQGIEAAAIASDLPFTGLGDSRVVAPAGAAAPRANAVDAMFIAVSDDFARTLGLRLLAGRDFSIGEVAASSEPAAIVDDALAQRLWPSQSALGELIQFLDADSASAGRPMRVVGVVPAVKHSFGNPRLVPHVYVPLGQHDGSTMTVQARIADARAEAAMLATIARVIREVDERVPVLRVETWRGHLDASLEVWVYRTGARVCASFGAIALLLAVIGIYGVKSYLVSQRTRELGIRMAIGAHPRALLWQVLGEGGRVTIYGIAIGVLLALSAGQLLRNFLYGVNGVEPVVLVGAPAILLVASLLASLVPALRATKVDPTVALRAE